MYVNKYLINAENTLSERNERKLYFVRIPTTVRVIKLLAEKQKR